MGMRTCVSPSGKFVYGIHQPAFCVSNLRENDSIADLGTFSDGTPKTNRINFPLHDVSEQQASRIFEIPNPFPFRGTTYINQTWADAKAQAPDTIRLPAPFPTSFSQTVNQWAEQGWLSSVTPTNLFETLPESLLTALASTSTDPNDLVHLADLCCDFTRDPATGAPLGLQYHKDAQNREKPAIKNEPLFEILVNNPYLPDAYKRIMVLKPGVQGTSEIVGEYSLKPKNCHIFEYLRRNSYIPWGHYAVNMADDSIRYHMRDLTLDDMKGLRHLYYQRTYMRMAQQVGLRLPPTRQRLSGNDIEALRLKIVERMSSPEGDTRPFFSKTLWGWNYGFDYAPSNYRLHASHQQIHQQYALVPSDIPVWVGAEAQTNTSSIAAFGCGDLIAETIATYRAETGHAFFDDYLTAIRNNERLDGNPNLPNSLILYEDEQVLLFVPKAQTSQWELQLMTLPPVGNILESNHRIRQSLDRAIFIAMKTLTAMGARMITTIEYNKSFSSTAMDQRLLYAFLPKLPESPGGFSESQLRWILGHYPEDFASACRSNCPRIEKD